MPNNFKLQGDYYVSKAGNDANDGLTPETPLLTVQAALNKVTTAVTRTIVVGSGVYKESISKTLSTTFTIYVVADGYVVFEGLNPSTDLVFVTSTQANGFIYFTGIEIRGYNQIYINLLQNAWSIYFIKCTIKNNIFVSITNATATSAIYFDSSIFINSIVKFNPLGVSFSALSAFSYDKCIFINSSMDDYQTTLNPTNNYYGYVSVFRNCYVDSNSLVRFRSVTNVLTGALSSGQTPSTAVINNNIQGKVVFPWVGSVSGISTWNVPITLAQAKIDYPTYFFNSVSADPKFNNPRLLDFTLQAGSPNVTASSDYVSNIGGTEYAVPFTASSAAFTTNATSQSLEYRGIYYAISGSATTGSITSGPMFLQWPRTKPLTSVNWIGALEFNKTITASLAGNNNVPAYTTFTSASGAQGANPDRLKIRLRYSTQQTQPSTDAEWDNGGYWTAGTYQLFEPNTKPKVDYRGIGNGDPTYVETSAIGDLVPSWIQTEIILRNDYNR